MAIVTAMTYRDDDRELPARQVSGELTTRYVPTLDYTQHWVGGVQVDPTTIRHVATRAKPKSGSKPKARRKRT